MFKFVKELEKRERWFLVVVILIATGIAFLPFLYGYIKCPPGFFFTWLGVYSPNDINVYYSYLQEIIKGHYTLMNFYTLESQTHGVLNIVWLGLGLIAKVAHLEPATVFHLSRLVLIPPAVILIYKFIQNAFSDFYKRAAATILAIFGSGFGIYIVLLTSQEPPLDINVADGFPYLVFYHSPHFISALILFVSIMWLMYCSLEKDKFKFSLLAGFLGLCLFNFHPYHSISLFAILWSVIFVWIALKRIKVWRGLGHGFVFFLISAPAVLYHVWMSVSEPIIRARDSVNITTVSSFSVLVLSYGIFMIGVAMALFILGRIKKAPPFLIFCSVWSLVVFVLMLSGINYERRFALALTIPLSILTICFFEKIKPVLKRAWNFSPAAVVVLATLLIVATTNLNISNMFFVYDNSLSTFSYHLAYIDPSRKQAFDWLDKKPLGSLRILADKFNSNLIPGQTGQRVYNGHWGETMNSEQKLDMLDWYFRNNKNDSQERLNFLKKENITYIFYSPSEVALGNLDPKKEFYLREVFSSGNTSIYEVDYSSASLQ